MALKEMIAHKRREVADRAAARPLESFKAGLTPSDRSLAGALSAPGARFILEYKKASPSRGTIRPDFSPADAARAYGPVADAVSVLIDQRFFGGRLEDMADLRAAVTQPVVAKDIVVSPYQVLEARFHGADAVLLMLSVLDDDGWRACREAADAYRMDIITEVHDETELNRALALGGAIIGINNRDLRTLKTDLGVTRRLAPKIPGDRLVICQSGIERRSQVRTLAPLVDAFLVGSSLMSAPRVDLAARALVHGRVKLCGLRRDQDVRLAETAGASFAGLIFAPQSPRALSPAQGERLAAGARLPMVGVFVDQPVDFVAGLANHLNLAVVQLHGSEDTPYIESLRNRIDPGREVWKSVAVRIRPPRRAPAGADRIVLDSYVPGSPGGNARRFPWRALAETPYLPRTVLAGGISAENAVEAAAVGAWAMDVCSGVERAPGVKDATRTAALFEALRIADRRREAA